MKEDDLIDNHVLNKKSSGKSYGKESYWLALISIFLWISTSVTVGVQGFLPWDFSPSRILSMILCAIILALSILGVNRAIKSKRNKEVRSKENRLGSIGNYMMLFIFALIAINNIVEIYIYFSR